MNIALIYDCSLNVAEYLLPHFGNFEKKVVSSIEEAEKIAKEYSHSVLLTSFFLTKLQVFSQWEEKVAELVNKFSTVLFFEPDYESDEFLQENRFRNFHFLFDNNINGGKVKFSNFLLNKKFISVSSYGFNPDVCSDAYWIVKDTAPRNSLPQIGSKRSCVFDKPVFEYACYVFEGYYSAPVQAQVLLLREKKITNFPFNFLSLSKEAPLSETGQIIYQTSSPEKLPSSEVVGFGEVSSQWQDLLKFKPMNFKICYAEKGVSSGNGCLYVNDRWVEESEYLAHFIYGNGHHEKGLTKFFEIKNINVPVIHAWVSVGYNYYHWLAQIVPFLYKVAQLFEKENIEDFCIVVGKISNFQKEYIDNIFFKFKNYRLISLEAFEAINANKGIYYGNSVGLETYTCNFFEQIEVANFLRNHIKKNESEVYPEKIYISRKDTPHRKMENEDLLIEKLEERGYTSITLTGKSVVEQISIFENAKYIIAPHGAGMTNIMFCKPHTRVLEFHCLQNKHEVGQICMAKIAQCANIDYASFFMREKGNEIDIDNLMNAIINFGM